MSAGEIYLGSAALAATIGALLLAWALFADRSRGRKRCPKCWYDMSAAALLRCPECGREMKGEKQLLKTRRRWKVAFASLLPFALAGFLAIQPKVQRDGWWSVMPTTLMLAYFQFKQDDAVIEAIERRMSDAYENPLFGTPMYVAEERNLYRWQWRWLAKRTASALAEDELTIAGRRTCTGWAGFLRDILDDEALQGRLQRAIAAQLSADHPTIIRSTSAICAVDARDPAGTIALMLPLLDDDDDRLHGAGVAGLRVLALRSDSDVAIQALIDLLDHRNVLVRDYAAGALYAASDRHRGRRAEVEQALRAANARAIERGGPRHRIVSTLARLTGPDEWLPPVREALDSDDPEVRAEALMFVSDGYINSSEFIEAVLRELRSEDATPEGRRAAAWALRQMDGETLRAHEDAIVELVNHDDQETSEAALAVLIRLDRTRDPAYADYP